MLYSIAAQVFSISSPAPGGTFVPFLTEKNTLCQEISLYTTKGGTDTCYGVQSVSPAAHILRSSVLPGEMAFANMDWSTVTIYAEHLDASSTTLLAAVYSRLCFFQTILLHGAFVDYGERGLVFTGPSGIGKTTQAELWQQYAGARIVNGDKVHVSQKFKKRFRQEIYYCKKYGVQSHLKHINDHHAFYKEHMYGQAYFINMVEPSLGQELLRLLDSISWEY